MGWFKNEMVTNSPIYDVCFRMRNRTRLRRKRKKRRRYIVVVVVATQFVLMSHQSVAKRIAPIR